MNPIRTRLLGAAIVTLLVGAFAFILLREDPRADDPSPRAAGDRSVEELPPEFDDEILDDFDALDLDGDGDVDADDTDLLDEQVGTLEFTAAQLARQACAIWSRVTEEHGPNRAGERAISDAYVPAFEAGEKERPYRRLADAIDDQLLAAEDRGQTAWDEAAATVAGLCEQVADGTLGTAAP